MNKNRVFHLVSVLVLLAGSFASFAAAPATAASHTYDINTLAGKVAAVNGTAGLQIRFSAFIEQEADMRDSLPNPDPFTAITPQYVLSSPLDGNAIQAPAVTVNLDTAGAPQNETTVAVDPNNPDRIVAAANDYVSRTWSCTISGTPCSALGDGYSGTYYSNDGGQSWQGLSTGPNDLGTLIPGVTRLTGGPYDAGGDPALAFDSQGNVYYAGLGFNRTSAPNTVAVNKGTFDSNGALTWSAPVFINATNSPSTLNDKEWIAADSHAGSPYQDRVYVTWTRFIFNPVKGSYVQSPIAVSYSSDGGQTFSSPQLISGNVLYGQGSRPVVAPDGTVYVFWDGSTRLSTLDSIYMVKSSDGGVTWSKPKAVSKLVDIIPLANTAFRVNSFPAAAAAPNGDLYVTWSNQQPNGNSSYQASTNCADWIVGEDAVRANCHADTYYSMSSDGGATWSSPQAAFTAGTQGAEGYPATNPDGSILNAPDPAPVETVFPGIAAGPDGAVYISAYSADVVSPWQTCAQPNPAGAAGRIDCWTLGNYVHNARLNYVVSNITAATQQVVTPHLINSRVQFGGGFMGDYTDIAVGADGRFHATWTDTNNKQDVVWFYGFEFVPTQINQEDIAIFSSP